MRSKSVSESGSWSPRARLPNKATDQIGISLGHHVWAEQFAKRLSARQSGRFHTHMSFRRRALEGIGRHFPGHATRSFHFRTILKNELLLVWIKYFRPNVQVEFIYEVEN